MKLWDVSLATGKLDSEVKARINNWWGCSVSGIVLADISCDNLSKTLQKESMYVLGGLHLAELTAKTPQKM